MFNRMLFPGTDFRRGDDQPKDVVYENRRAFPCLPAGRFWVELSS
jgi:hypothetical protein